MYVPKYFREEEFQKLTPACSLSDLSQDLLFELDHLRERLGEPIIITSAYRSRDWDLAKGRSGEGAHTKGLAVDISLRDSVYARRLLEAALKGQWEGIGIGKTFIHLDVMWRPGGRRIWGY